MFLKSDFHNIFQAVEQGGEIAVRQAVTRLNSVSSPYPETKKKR